MAAKKTRKPRLKKVVNLPIPAPIEAPVEIIKDIVLSGNIGKMHPDEKVKYYTLLCKSLGLNPLTQPFQIIVLQGRETLYATKTATEQLRRIYGVSVEKIDQKTVNDVMITTVTVKDKTGRTDGATGAVSIAGLKGDSLANAIMKSETKAKRRATLSICGLGMLDESEIETIPGAKTAEITIEAPKTEPSATESHSIKLDDEQLEGMYKEAITMIETSQTGKQLHDRAVNYKNVPFKKEQRDELNQIFSRRFRELSGGVK
jgi:hypothetical protein